MIDRQKNRWTVTKRETIKHIDLGKTGWRYIMLLVMLKRYPLSCFQRSILLTWFNWDWGMDKQSNNKVFLLVKDIPGCTVHSFSFISIPLFVKVDFVPWVSMGTATPCHWNRKDIHKYKHMVWHAWANVGPTWGCQDPGGPPCWPHDPCYLG